MSAECPTLAGVIAAHPEGQDWGIPNGECTECEEYTSATWAEHIESAWREACTIRTLEELNALPVGSIVVTMWDPAPHHVMTRFTDGWFGWPSRDCPLFPLGAAKGDEWVLLVWHPGWARG